VAPVPSQCGRRNAERGIGTRKAVFASAFRLPQLDDLAQSFGRNLTRQREEQLAAKLGLPVEAVGRVVGLGWDADHGCWTIPERDAAGKVVGISTRFPDGTKRAVPGSRRGLTLPAGWADLPGPLLVVEGMSDAVALAHCGVSAVGRPSNRGGVELLAALLARTDPGTPVLVVGENDRKADGSWPGRDGAQAVAAELVRLTGRPVLTACPPEEYKDAREWVCDRLAGQADGADPSAVGKDIAAALCRASAAARGAAPPGRADRFPVPLPLPVLTAAAEGRGVPWVWDGFLMRGGVTLLSALPKCGKTTLLSHLLKGLGGGGEFCGRPLLPGRAVVVSEEGPEVWADRRDRLGIGGHVRLLSRPFFGRPSGDDWQAFLLHLIACVADDPADLIVFDTLADLWPVKDENNATDVQGALQPVRRLADGRAVLLVHHLRKSDGAEGTGSRGSGALAGFVDVICELRRAGRAADPGGAKRVLTAVGRMPGIPNEWAVELDEAGGGYRHAGDASGLREAVRAALTAAGGDGLTFAKLRDALPAAWRSNERRVRDEVAFGVEERFWDKEDRATRHGGPVYRIGGVSAEAEERMAVEGVLFPGGEGLPD
jgi:hypothetical protein